MKNETDPSRFRQGITGFYLSIYEKKRMWMTGTFDFFFSFAPVCSSLSGDTHR